MLDALNWMNFFN
ncbi:unnamed protein product [Linum tenue]|uniref:Uncharacterized protein n=1 Tax=Linum tenue TaxID=586396 RepID=A0AAV0S5W6_9ROSI|nr:unnamed protein product [Linum tenue]